MVLMLSQKISMYMLDVNLEPGEDMEFVLEEAHDTGIAWMLEKYSANITDNEVEAFATFLDNDPSIDQVADYFVKIWADQSELESWVMEALKRDLEE